MKKKIDKSYVSPLDIFLAEYDQKNPHQSESQRKEREKYARIARLRGGEDGKK